MARMMEETQGLGYGKVYLTGGGCGDAGLVTVKAVKALQSCDAVVYDSLVSGELLQWTRPECERIYVGKRYRRHSRKQDEINALLAKMAREGKTVVRLKGGDPYVFGRGGEEFMALLDAGICCEIIPGITSAIAVPAAAGIPVTHRGLSDSVTVVTGTAAKTEGKEACRLDFQTLARLKGTLVILMGMHRLAEIAAGLLGAGKDPGTPCAIIMEGTTARQRVLRAPLSGLYERAVQQAFTSPAVIVVGAVAALSLTAAEAGAGGGDREPEASDGPVVSDKEAETSDGPVVSGRETEASDEPVVSDRETEAFDGTAASDRTEKERQCMLPLAGTSVGVTGTTRFADRMSAALLEKGADVCDMSFMEIRPAQESLPDFSDCGWLVFTSPNGVKVFLDKMRREERDLRKLSGQKIAVIGPGTAEAFKEAGLYPDYMPKVYDAKHLAQGLTDVIAQETGQESTEARPAVFLRAKQGSGILPQIFSERGIPYTEYALYELGVRENKRDAVIRKEPDYIVFGSAMGARAYFRGLEKKGIRHTGSRYVCIGEWCAKEVRRYVNTQPLVAEEACVDAVVSCLCREKVRGKEL